MVDFQSDVLSFSRNLGIISRSRSVSNFTIPAIFDAKSLSPLIDTNVSDEPRILEIFLLRSATIWRMRSSEYPLDIMLEIGSPEPYSTTDSLILASQNRVVGGVYIGNIQSWNIKGFYFFTGEGIFSNIEWRLF